MTKRSLLFDLVLGILTLLPYILAVDITDIFTVQKGSMNGGCDGREAVLDQWLTETIYSLVVAIDAIDDYRQDMNVRRSMATIFGIKNDARLSQNSPRYEAVQKIRDYMQYSLEFFNHVQDGTGPLYDRNIYWLFCHSTFLSRREPSDPAFDYQGNEILDQNNHTIRIEDVPRYQEELAKDAKAIPWWSGEHTNSNGYYFTEHGADFCSVGVLGGTAALQQLREDASVPPEAERRQLANVVLCPESFDTNPRPASYRDANDMITTGTNLADVVPKSATLLHEAFHALNGEEFLSGAQEEYRIAECLKLPPASARVNPKNYVFFIAHMYHLRGEEDADEPWSIKKHWGFLLTGSGGNRVFSATENIG